MKKVTIINVYGQKNLGDSAILSVALGFIKEAFKGDCEISLICEGSNKYLDHQSNKEKLRSYELPYAHAIRSKNGNKVSDTIKIIRFFQICFKTIFLMFLGKIFPKVIPSEGFFGYISSIKNADLVIGIGGGYLITNSMFKDYFGLVLTILSVYVAKFYNRNILFLPISFGPFASKYQEKLAYMAIKNTTIMTRDYITLDRLKKIDNEKLIKKLYVPDLALFYKNKTSKLNIKLKSDYIVLTAREWLSDFNKQQAYENSLVQFVDMISDEHKLKTIFIPMARNIVEDDDNRIAKRIQDKVRRKNSFKIVDTESLDEIQAILGKARAAVCTRMHSAILASTVYTPFIAIGYGHKTLGFVKSYNLEEWYVDISDVDFYKLEEKFSLLLEKKKYIKFIKTLAVKQEEIKKYKKNVISELSGAI